MKKHILVKNEKKSNFLPKWVTGSQGVTGVMGGHRGQVGSHGSLLVLGVTLESQGSVWGQGVTWVTFGPRGHGGSQGSNGGHRVKSHSWSQV